MVATTPSVPARRRAGALALLLVLGLVGPLLGSCKPDDRAAAEAEAPREVRKPLVAVQPIEPTSYDWTLRYVGRIAPDVVVNLAFEIPGTVAEVAADEGDVVEKGEVLARLDTKLLESERDQARANLDIARREQERSRRLYEQSVTARAQRDDAESRLALRRAVLAGVEERLRKSVLRSPIDGVVSMRDLEVRETAPAYAPVFTVGDPRVMVLKLWAPEHQVVRIEEGDVVHVAFDAFPGREFEGTVAYVAVAADPERRLFKIEVTIPNEDGPLKTGLIGRAEIVTERLEDVVVVPLRFSQVRGGERVLFVERDGKAERVVLAAPRIHEKQLVVPASDLPEGRLVTAGMDYLTGGEEVRVSERERPEPLL